MGSTPSKKDFLKRGGTPGLKFPTVGTRHKGTIKTVYDPEERTDFDTGAKVEGKYQMRVDLETEYRDPEVAEDEGLRTLYIASWMTGAVGDAVKEAGAEELKPGGVIDVEYTGNGPSRRPQVQGPKLYSVIYTPPAANYFKNAAPATAPTAAGNGSTGSGPDDTPPPGIDKTSWQAMTQDVRDAVLAAAAGMKK